MSELCILIIDDDTSFNYLNKRAIKKFQIDAEVITFAKADEALAEIADGSIYPDLILLDINMPGMNGWQFIEKYQKISEDLKKSNIIILTSSISPIDMNQAAGYPEVIDFFSKPLSKEHLEKIREMFISEGKIDKMA